MSLSVSAPPPLPPHSLSIPPAPRIGTSGSPLDPPCITSRQPREGLGLGGIEMPEGMKGTAEGQQDRKLDTRYLAFKAPRANHFRHAASVSSPPSLIPFVKSLHSSSPASAPPAPSVTSRKFSLQSTTTSNGGGYGGHSRKGSEGLISYPIVSLRDTLPTFTPDEERRPAPIPTTTINDQRSAPPPPPLPQSRTTTVDEDRTPTPQQRRPSRTTRSPPPPLDLEFAGSNYSVFPVRQSATKIRRGSNAMMTERMEKVPSNSSSSSGRIRGLRISHSSSRASSSQFDSSEEDDSPRIGNSRRGSHAFSQASSHRGHRRTASEESPRIVQAVTFTRAKSADDVLPAELPIKQLLGGGGSTTPTRTWNTASPALIPISEVKAAKAKAKALESPTKATTTSRSTTSASTRKSSESSSSMNSINISVKDSVQTKEFGKAGFGGEGITVCLKSYTRPEDMEVSWSCVPKVDEDGRTFTQWEMKFKPRSTTSSLGNPPAQALPPLPAPSLSSSNSSFLNYRMNAPPPPPPPFSSSSTAHPLESIGRKPSTTSPLTQTIDPLAYSHSHSYSVPSIDSRRRKSSSTSTSRSDSFSNGTSFSSESSVGPPTPASSVSGHRRRKSSSSASHHEFYGSGDQGIPPPPPLPPASYFDIPIPPTSTPPRSCRQSSDRGVHEESPSRTNRSSSYNIGRTTRQLSIDQSVYVPRSASVPDTSIKSPTRGGGGGDNRFARCLPPSGESKLDLVTLISKKGNSDDSTTVSSSSLISTAGGGFGSGGSSSSFLASRNNNNGRKQSIAPPPSLSIPPLPVSLDDSSSSSTTSNSGAGGGTSTTGRLTSPFTPSPLGRSSNNLVYNNSNSSMMPSSINNNHHNWDQNRTPTRTQFLKLSTTPTPSPPGGGGGTSTSEELVSNQSRSISPSPSPSSFSTTTTTTEEDNNNNNDEGFFPPCSPSPSEIEEQEEREEEDLAFEERMRFFRQGKRMMSRWSDTETEDDDDQHQHLRDRVGETSWGLIPDDNLSTTTDDDD